MSDKPAGFEEAVRGFAGLGTPQEQPEPEAAPEEELTQEAEALSESEDEPEEQPEEPDEDEEQDSEEEDAGEAVDEDEPEEQEEEEEPSFTVQLDGKEHEVSLSELKDGYLRQADYTRKTQAQAEQRKTLDAQAEQVAQKQEELIQALELVPQQLLGTPPDRPDINLMRIDPQAYEEQKYAFEQYHALKEGFEKWLGQAKQERDESQAKKRAEVAQEEGKKFLEAFADEVKDEPSFGAKVSSLHNYLQESYGYQPQELAGMVDHRAYVIADKARKYDELMAENKPKAALKAKKAKIKPVLSKSAQRKPKRTSERDQARKRFEQAASREGQSLSRKELIDSAAAAFAQRNTGSG